MAVQAYGLATHSQTARVHAHKLRRRVWLPAAAVLIAAMIALGVAAYLLRPQPVHCTDPSCITLPSVPLYPPAASYTSSQWGFSLEYDPLDTPSKRAAGSVSWNEGDARWTIAGDTANGREAQQIVEDLQAAKYPGAKAAYPPSGIPRADLGYRGGYGQVYDLWVRPAAGQSQHERVVIIAAKKGDLAIEMYGDGTYHEPSEAIDGLPNPASTSFVNGMSYNLAVNTVRWPGDPPL